MGSQYNCTTIFLGCFPKVRTSQLDQSFFEILKIGFCMSLYWKTVILSLRFLKQHFAPSETADNTLWDLHNSSDDIACEQVLCSGKLWKNREEREEKGREPVEKTFPLLVIFHPFPKQRACSQSTDDTKCTEAKFINNRFIIHSK